MDSYNNICSPRSHHAWFSSSCSSNHTDCRSEHFPLYFDIVHPNHVLVLFCVCVCCHKYHPIASALSDYIPSVQSAEKHLRVVSLLLPFTACFHTTQPVRYRWENLLFSFYALTCNICPEPQRLFISWLYKRTWLTWKSESDFSFCASTKLITAPKVLK